MESVFHINDISRPIEAPICVGHTEYIHYGDTYCDDDDDLRGIPAVTMRLGCPLETADYGNTLSRVPLIKTIGYIPDPTRDVGNIYLETIHYRKDVNNLIPVRTKIQSGPSQGLRITHLPSLTNARCHLTGDYRRPVDIRSEIVHNLLEHDAYFSKHQAHPVMEWIRNDLTHIVTDTSVCNIGFSSQDITHMIHKYTHAVKDILHEMSVEHLKGILSTITLSHEVIPHHYKSTTPILHTLGDLKHRLSHHNVDFRCPGRLNIDHLRSVQKNPFGFEKVLDLLDRVPLTDFNLDLVVDTDCDVGFYHENIAVNRLAVFEDNELGSFETQSLLSELLDPTSLAMILRCFMQFHTHINDQILEILTRQPVKLKLIKTLNDEALVLIYHYQARPGEEPLCGVYFDIAVQSLAPLTIVPEPIAV